MKSRLAIATALAALAAPAAAQAAPPAPFGHVCLPQNGVLYCPTASDAQRVPSFDGVPLDVDVTLPPPATGRSRPSWSCTASARTRRRSRP